MRATQVVNDEGIAVINAPGDLRVLVHWDNDEQRLMLQVADASGSERPIHTFQAGTGSGHLAHVWTAVIGIVPEDHAREWGLHTLDWLLANVADNNEPKMSARMLGYWLCGWILENETTLTAAERSQVRRAERALRKAEKAAAA